MVAGGNPKAILFFSALFPQFIDTTMAHGPQIIVLLVTMALEAFGCYMFYATSGQHLIRFFAAKNIGKYVSRFIGVTFIGSGIGLLLSHRR